VLIAWGAIFFDVGEAIDGRFKPSRTKIRNTSTRPGGRSIDSSKP
jgi:hypothetical protein